ncbi:MAG: hypothetical protein KDE19_19070, partial [Caldilineaceae bacterium]|nr:hypothetical protein [Caldilineaceae bacterium]
YSKKVDLTQRQGQTAGIDPHHGRIWFGNSILDVVTQRDADGYDVPLFLFVLVKKPTFAKVVGLDYRSCHTNRCPFD